MASTLRGGALALAVLSALLLSPTTIQARRLLQQQAPSPPAPPSPPSPSPPALAAPAPFACAQPPAGSPWQLTSGVWIASGYVGYGGGFTGWDLPTLLQSELQDPTFFDQRITTLENLSFSLTLLPDPAGNDFLLRYTQQPASTGTWQTGPPPPGQPSCLYTYVPPPPPPSPPAPPPPPASVTCPSLDVDYTYANPIPGAIIDPSAGPSCFTVPGATSITSTVANNAANTCDNLGCTGFSLQLNVTDPNAFSVQACYITTGFTGAIENLSCLYMRIH